jgi:carbamoyl-phosphate synthase small subunit
VADVTHINLNDDTVEGLRFKRFKGFSVQFHPEASPGPHDSHYLFDEFMKEIKSGTRVPANGKDDDSFAVA